LLSKFLESVLLFVKELLDWLLFFLKQGLVTLEFHLLIFLFGLLNLLSGLLNRRFRVVLLALLLSKEIASSVGVSGLGGVRHVMVVAAMMSVILFFN
jgi:hypothetical protein